MINTNQQTLAVVITNQKITMLHEYKAAKTTPETHEESHANNVIIHTYSHLVNVCFQSVFS